jgi:integrase
MVPYRVNSPIMKADPGDYIVGEDLVPGPCKTSSNTPTNRWNKMRDTMGWTKDKVLYSLRDTGIVQLITDGLDLHFIMRQADHKSIETTNRYVQHYFPQGIEAVRTQATPFVPRLFTAVSAGDPTQPALSPRATGPAAAGTVS